MASIDVRFSGSVPANYERYMVPLLFHPYAQQMAERAQRRCSRSGSSKRGGNGRRHRALADALPDAKLSRPIQPGDVDIAPAPGFKLRVAA